MVISLQGLLLSLIIPSSRLLRKVLGQSGLMSIMHVSVARVAQALLQLVLVAAIRLCTQGCLKVS